MKFPLGLKLAVLILLLALFSFGGYIFMSSKLKRAGEESSAFSSDIQSLYSGASSEVGEEQKENIIEERSAAPVKAYKVVRMDFRDELPVIGTIKGTAKVDLRFEISGVVEKYSHKEGDFLRKGTLVAKLKEEDILLKIEYRQAKLGAAEAAESSSAKKFEIHQQLYKIGAIIEVKLEEVRLAHKAAQKERDAAEIELRSAKEELKKVYLYAYREGLLTNKDIYEGEFVTSQVRIGTIVQTDEVFIEAGIIERDIDKVSLGHEVTVYVDAYSDKEFKGRIEQIFPVVEGRSRTLTIRGKILNSDRLLLPGMFGRVSIAVFEKMDTIVIPSVALTKPSIGTNTVFVIEDETAYMRQVEVGYVTTDYVQIDEGLEEGELVVVEMTEELQDGQSVEVVEVEEME